MKQISKYPVLRGAMAAYGITVNMLAKKLNKSPSTIFAKLSGRIAFDLKEAIAIRNAFFAEISLDELFAQSEQLKMPAKSEKKTEVCLRCKTL